jgi:Na+/proline symporter
MALFLIINSVISLLLYYFAIKGINHFVETVSDKSEAKRDEIILKGISTILLLILLGCNGIIYYNYVEDGGTVDVVEKE